MDRWKPVLTRFPAWTFTFLTLAAILWLTLAPKPLGEEPPPLFEGADKIVHGIMFGGLTSMMLLDWQRKHGWTPTGWVRAMICSSLSSIVGIIIEMAQSSMGLGREFELGDIVSDTVGAFIFGVGYIFLQKIWCQTPYK